MPTDSNPSWISRAVEPWFVATLGVGSAILVVGGFLLIRGTLGEDHYAQRLSDESPAVREAAARKLAHMGSMKLLPFLADLEGSGVRVETSDWIREYLSEHKESIIESLLDLWPLSSWQRRIGIAKLFGKVGGEESPAVQEHFFNLLKHGDTGEEVIAMELLVTSGGERASVLSALLERLKDESVEIRAAAVSGLWNFPNHTEKILPRIRTQYASEPSPGQRLRILSFYSGKADQKQAVDLLLVGLRDPSPKVRFCACSLLGRYGGEDLRAVRALVEALKGEDSGFRTEALSSLGMLGGSASNALDEVMRFLERGNPFERQAAAEALGKIGVSSDRMLRLLQASTKDEEQRVRLAAEEALGWLRGTE